MKHVFTSHKDIAREFISGNFDNCKGRKRCANACTDGQTFISYSTPVARKYGRGQFIALDSYRYSVITAQQTSEIERYAAAANLDTFRVPDIYHLNSAANVEYYRAAIEGVNAKLRRARSDSSRNYLKWKLRDLLAGWRSLVDCCRIEGLKIANITL